MPKLMDVLIDAAELLDWSVHIYDDCIEFEKYSPAGEDFIFTITGNDEARVAEQVREYAYDFDPDEHAEMWVESRGKRGVPDSIRTLIDDADAIKEMAFELADALRKAEEEYQKEVAGRFWKRLSARIAENSLFGISRSTSLALRSGPAKSAV